MRTAYCPKSHGELANVKVGKEYGHVPGHQYHDVAVVVSTRNGKFRCHVCESWGSSQGYDEEHGRSEVIGRGDSISQACAESKSRAIAAGIQPNFLVQAISQAEDSAEECLVDAK